MSIQDDLLILEYLDRVSDQLVGKLGPNERTDKVEELRKDIEAHRARLAGTHRQKLTGRRKEADVSRILHEIGPPEVVAGRILRDVLAGQAPDSAAERTAVDDAGTGTMAIDTPGLPTIEPVSGTGADEQATGWISTRARTAAERVWSSGAGGTQRRRSGVLLSYIEVAALIAYTVGSLLMSYVGLLVGAVLTLFSRRWDERDKAVAIVLAPALTLGVGMFVVWISEGRDRSGSTSERFERVWTALGDVFDKMPLVAGALAAIYLLYRLLTVRR